MKPPSSARLLAMARQIVSAAEFLEPHLEGLAVSVTALSGRQQRKLRKLTRELAIADGVLAREAHPCSGTGSRSQTMTFDKEVPNRTPSL